MKDKPIDPSGIGDIVLHQIEEALEKSLLLHDDRQTLDLLHALQAIYPSFSYKETQHNTCNSSRSGFRNSNCESCMTTY